MCQIIKFGCGGRCLSDLAMRFHLAPPRSSRLAACLFQPLLHLSHRSEVVEEVLEKSARAGLPYTISADRLTSRLDVPLGR